MMDFVFKNDEFRKAFVLPGGGVRLRCAAGGAVLCCFVLFCAVLFCFLRILYLFFTYFCSVFLRILCLFCRGCLPFPRSSGQFSMEES